MSSEREIRDTTNLRKIDSTTKTESPTRGIKHWGLSG
jgi:hypothetical protein